jgi:F0F1-type ATP synthase assembly protein I
MIAGSIIGGRANDWRRAKLLAASTDNKVDPESRLVDQIWGVIVCAAGALMFGWFADRAIHPAGLLIATFIGEYFQRSEVY